MCCFGIVTSSGSLGDHLGFDWAFQRRGAKTPRGQILKINRYEKGLNPRVVMGDGRSGSWAPDLALLTGRRKIISGVGLVTTRLHRTVTTIINV